jgi:hypothetical protein
MMDVKINKNRHRARNRTRALCDFNQRPHGFQRAGNFDFRYGVINVVSTASRALPLIRFRAYRCVASLGDQIG